MVQPLTMVFRAPSEYELQKQIFESERYAEEHPELAPYFKVMEESFKEQLRVVKENPQDDYRTREGASDLSNKMAADQKLCVLGELLKSLIKVFPEVYKYGFSVGDTNGKAYFFKV